MNRAVELFGQLQKVDPYRLENMDIYSDLLYVKVWTNLKTLISLLGRLYTSQEIKNDLGIILKKPDDRVDVKVFWTSHRDRVDAIWVFLH